MGICVANNDKTVINSFRNSFIQNSSERSVCVSSHRDAFNVKSAGICVEQGKTQPQIRQEVELFVPTLGQTNFILSQVPKNPEESFIMDVNGLVQRYGPDYFVIGNILTFTDDIYQLSPSTDDVLVKYFY